MLFEQPDQAIGLFAAIILGLLVIATTAGHWIGSTIRRRNQPSEASCTAVGFATGSMLGLFAFLLATALSMASTRLEARRDSVLHEANAIGTAWLRAGLIGGQEGADIQKRLHEYIEIRIAAVRDVTTDADEARLAARTSALQRSIWQPAQRVARQTPTPISGQLIAALNETFDLSLTNRRNFASHVPPYIVALLLTAAVLSVGAMGYYFGLNGGRHAIITTLLLVLWTAAVALVIDIDNPRGGLVRISPAPLIWTLQGFEPSG